MGNQAMGINSLGLNAFDLSKIALSEVSELGLNEIATEFIFTMSKGDMEKLQDVTKCNKLIQAMAQNIETLVPLSEIKKVFSQMKSNHDIKDAPARIAVFYVKIAHVYGAIMKTINPTDSLCATRMFAQEPNNEGLTELDMLYNDFNYDLQSGEFKGRSNKMDKLYNQHLETFYRAFTGQSMMDYNIKAFSDIPVTLHAKRFQPPCEDVVCLFEKYAVNLSNSIHYASEAYAKLMSIMDELFLDHTIHPDLTEDKLTNIVSRARKIILELYIECETSYANGVQIYEAISNKILLETLKGQQTELMKQRTLLKNL